MGSKEQAPPLRLEYLDPAQLAENPANWRLHPPEQVQAIDAAIDEVGWAGALLFNERTGRLLDGHARRKLFAGRTTKVPVLIGSWDEATERKILAMLDPLGDMAATNQEALADLLQSVDPDGVATTLRKVLAPHRVAYRAEVASVVDLKPHPRNYRQHPPEQLEHLVRSIEDRGIYRPIVVAREGTILAGHGIALAAARLGLVEVPVIRLDLDPNDSAALKLLAGDNEVSGLAEDNPRLLTEMLKEVLDADGLVGTGFDMMALSALAYTTRTRDEFATHDAAAHWAGGGMPEFGAGPQIYRLTMHFRSKEDRDEFMKKYSIEGVTRVQGTHSSAWWPKKERQDDLSSLRWEEKAKEKVTKPGTRQ